jgi:hypothetical protein
MFDRKAEKMQLPTGQRINVGYCNQALFTPAGLLLRDIADQESMQLPGCRSCASATGLTCKNGLLILQRIRTHIQRLQFILHLLFDPASAGHGRTDRIDGPGFSPREA